jgi:hypothetical protein
MSIRRIERRVYAALGLKQISSLVKVSHAAEIDSALPVGVHNGVPQFTLCLLFDKKARIVWNVVRKVLLSEYVIKDSQSHCINACCLYCSYQLDAIRIWNFKPKIQRMTVAK